MMRTILIVMALLPLAGCERLLVRTDSHVHVDNPIITQVTAEVPPVAVAGPLRQVVVSAGTSQTKIAIVDVDGILLNTPFAGPSSLGENPVALFEEKLKSIKADPCIRAVVLRINSPGGGVGASHSMRTELLRFKAETGLPVVASLLDNATGGAYYLASASDAIVTSPTSVTGGVGVILNLYNLRDLMAQFNILTQSITAGKLAEIGTPARNMTEEEKQILVSMAEEYHKLMNQAVRTSRPQLRGEDALLLDGRVFTGSQAVQNGLADRIGDLPDAIAIATQLTQQTACTPTVVLLRRGNDPAHSMYAVSANVPLQAAGILPSIPGLDRTRIPTFLSMWQPELTMEKLSGK